MEESDFWKTIYEEYEILNPYYISKYKFDIQNLSPPSEIKAFAPEQIPFYSDFYKYINNEVFEKSQKIIISNDLETELNKIMLLNHFEIDRNRQTITVQT